MKARSKFLIGGGIVLGTAAALAWSSVKDTGAYFMTPHELRAKLAAEPRFAAKTVKVGALVVPGTIERKPGGRDFTFRAAYEGDTIAVAYHGIVPDTFTDGVDVVVEGTMGGDGVFAASTLLAKCASRYENAPGSPGGKPASKPAAPSA
jgi:cytochrome c-type biogenesis protein CcmE